MSEALEGRHGTAHAMALALALVLGGCGDDDDPRSASDTTTDVADGADVSDGSAPSDGADVRDDLFADGADASDDAHGDDIAAETEVITPDTDVGDEVVAPVPLPALDMALRLTPGVSEVDVHIQPSLAWGPTVDGKRRLAVVWTGDDTDSAEGALGIFRALYDVDGAGTTVVAPPERLSAHASGQHNVPTVCALADAGYVVVWSLDKRTGAVGDDLRVMWVRLTADGDRVGDEEQEAQTERPGNHWLGHVACRAGGGFTIVGVRPALTSEGFEVFVWKFAATGAPEGEPFAVFARDDGSQVNPQVAIGPADTTWVAWEDWPGGDSDTTIAARLFGGTVSERLDVHARAGADAVGAVIAVNGSGRALVGGVLDNRLRWSLSDGAATTALTMPDSGTTTSAAAAATDDGYTLVWYAGTGANVAVRFAQIGRDDTIGAPTTIDTGSFPLAYRPALAVVPGHAGVAWTQALGGGHYAVRVALFRP